MTTDPKREAFEKWAKGRGYQRDELDRCTIGIVGPAYYNSNTEMAWQAYQAGIKSNAAQEIDTSPKHVDPAQPAGDEVRAVLAREVKRLAYEYADDITSGGKHGGTAHDALHAAIDSLAALQPPAEGAVGWVSVFDELPSTSGSVLVFSCTGAFRVESARFVRELHASLEPGEDPAFTHWMPLPATPNAGLGSPVVETRKPVAWVIQCSRQFSFDQQDKRFWTPLYLSPPPRTTAMSDGKHTPGPWQQAHRMTCNGRGFWNTEVFCAKGETIATISWYPMPTTPGGVTSTYREANARLIAAAPELLAALAWREQFERRPGEDSNDLFERIAVNFHRETGFLRPGKDCREHSCEDRQAAWDAWMEAGRARVRAAISKAEGGAPA